MTPRQHFQILSKDLEPKQANQYLRELTVPLKLGDHWEAAKEYLASDELIDAVNTALVVGAPLLITGEPGTGKTQVAYYAARRLDLPPPYSLFISSGTEADDLLYTFDRVSYFHASQNEESNPGELLKSELDRLLEPGIKKRRGRFIQPGPLWHAYLTDGPSIVLLDEIDKAPRDFPNDLLHVLDQHRFEVTEVDPPRLIKGRATQPPLVIITSNSEKRLPEPFLRRCIFHHIVFDFSVVREIVNKRAGDFKLDSKTIDAAMDRFAEMRARPLRSKPATAELLVWLVVLSARGNISARKLKQPALSKLPAVGCLVKDRDDLESLS